MIEKFSVPELTALKNELVQSTLDSMQGAELLQMFLIGRGYGVSHEAARDASPRCAGCASRCCRRDSRLRLSALTWMASRPCCTCDAASRLRGTSR